MKALYTLSVLVALGFCSSGEAHQGFWDGNITYNQARTLCAHNAFANVEEGWLLPWGASQQHSIPQQLAIGISAFMLDLWPHTPSGMPQDLNVYISHGDPNSWYSFLFGAPADGLRPFFSVLKDIASSLKQNAQKIITLFLEDYTTQEHNSLIEEALTRSATKAFLFQPHKIEQKQNVTWSVEQQGWPTLAWMRHNDLRLVVFSSREHSPFAFTWDYVQENTYGLSSLSKKTRSTLRAECMDRETIVAQNTNGQPLLSINHFPSLPLNLGNWFRFASPYLSPSSGNDLKNALASHMTEAKGRFGVFPTFVTVNFALGLNPHKPSKRILQFVERNMALPQAGIKTA